MATVTTRLPALIDYVVNLFTASALIGAASPPVTVFDGPQVTELDAQLALWVGLSDPDSLAAEQAGDSVQEWAALGRLGRNETATIRCCSQAWSGDDSPRTARLAAYGIVQNVETVMQSDTFGGLTLFPLPGITNEVLTQNTTDRGAIARVSFELIFRNRIGGF